MPLSKAAPVAPRRLLREEVYDRLFRAILQGTFGPGEILKDGELSEWLGISRSPIRDALLRLADIGFVEFKPSSFTRVAPLDARRATESAIVVGALLEQSVKKSFGALSDSQVAGLKALNASVQEAADATDLALALYSYFEQICALSGSSLLLKAYRENSPQIMRFVATTESARGDAFRPGIQVLTEHAASGDVQAAYEVSRSFTQEMRSLYIQAFLETSGS